MHVHEYYLKLYERGKWEIPKNLRKLLNYVGHTQWNTKHTLKLSVYYALKFFENTYFLTRKDVYKNTAQ